MSEEIKSAKIGLYATVIGAVLAGIFVLMNTIIQAKLDRPTIENTNATKTNDKVIVQIESKIINDELNSENKTDVIETIHQKVKEKQFLVSGRVIDYITNSPIPDVEVSSSVGIIGSTDKNGLFRWSFNKKVQRLYFSHKNYEPFNSYYSIPNSDIIIRLQKRKQ